MIIDMHAHYVPPDLLERVRADGRRLGVTLVDSEVGTHLHFGARSVTRPFFPGMTDLAAREQRLQEAGIRLQVLSPWMDLAGYDLPPERQMAWARLLNNLMTASLQGRPSFRGFAHLPLCDGRAAATELERAVCTLGLSGAQVGTHGGGGRRAKRLSDPDLEPLWATAAALGVPLLLHPHGVAEPGAGPLHLCTRYPLATTEAALELVLAGVPDRHPDLRVVLIHGGGFLPYQAGRFARHWAQALGRSFQSYLRFFVYDTIVDPRALSYLAELVGWDRIVLGSDMPFAMGDPDPVHTVLAAVPPGLDRVRVLGANGARLLETRPTEGESE